jgi:hypothetical protein
MPRSPSRNDEVPAHNHLTRSPSVDTPSDAHTVYISTDQCMRTTRPKRSRSSIDQCMRTTRQMRSRSSTYWSVHADTPSDALTVEYLLISACGQPVRCAHGRVLTDQCMRTPRPMRSRSSTYWSVHADTPSDALTVEYLLISARGQPVRCLLRL